MNNTLTPWKIIQKELLRAQDVETIILKSHLLIETQINAALEAGLGSGIDALRLSFAQKLELLVCIWPTLKDKSILGARSLYDDWKGMNEIRNKIAHRLSPPHLRTLLIDWVTKTLGYKLRTINRTSVLKRNIVKAVVCEVGCFSGEIDARKKWLQQVATEGRGKIPLRPLESSR